MSRFTVVHVDSPSPTLDVEADILAGIDAELRIEHLDRPGDVASVAADADAIICRFLPIDRATIEACPNLRVIVRTGVGFDNIDVKAASERGIVVCNGGDYCVEEVATDAIALLLACNRRVIEQNDRVRNGPPIRLHLPGQGFSRPVGRLSTQTLGLISLGRIGRAVADRAAAFGLTILAHDPFVDPADAARAGVTLVELNELLERSDYVSIHAPLTDATRHLISRDQLALMKPSAYLIATSRGNIIDEDALAEALENEEIAGAALDVWAVEPTDPANPLLAFPQVIGSPHTAYYSQDSAELLHHVNAESVVSVLSGEMPRTAVNATALAVR